MIRGSTEHRAPTTTTTAVLHTAVTLAHVTAVCMTQIVLTLHSLLVRCDGRALDPDVVLLYMPTRHRTAATTKI